MASVLAPSGQDSSTPFELHLASLAAGEIRVVSFEGREAISQLFAFDVRFLTAREWGDIEPAVVCQPGKLVLRPTPEAPRMVTGMVAALEARRTVRGMHEYRARLVPRMWLLRHKRGSRIFQDRTIAEIVAAVLGEAGIAHRWSAEDELPRHEYCLQYDETDYQFVRRLCAEAGIYFYFDGETVVFGDSVSAYGPARGTPVPEVRFRERSDALADDEEVVDEVFLRHVVRSTATELRDYEFRAPLRELVGNAGHGHGDGAPSHEPRLEVYDHRGDFEEQDAADAMALVHLQQHRADADRARGASTCRAFSPGLRFALVDHLHDALNREYVITAVRHAGHVPRELAGRDEALPGYSNRFECVPSHVVARPRRPRTRVQQVFETAVVTGPQGEDVCVDELGRVKVQFYWDRDGKHDEHSSCWVRVSQSWAGMSWGTQFIPRIGMEVVVSFLGGDTDRPLIVGAVYNRTHPPAFRLPKDKTRSGWRTRSSPGGAGNNELSFEDAAGAEEIYLHAQRNLRETVLHDHTTTVGADETTTVAGNETLAVGANHTIAVAFAQSVSVGAEYSLAVLGNATTQVTATSSEHVGANKTVSVDHNHSLRVGGNARTDVSGSFRGDLHGAVRVVVGTEGKQAPAELDVHGAMRGTASKTLELVAHDGLTLRCGDSVIELTPERVRITSKEVSVLGKDTATLSASGPKLVLDGKAVLKADEIRIVGAESLVHLTKTAEVRGTSVAIGTTQPPPNDDPSKDEKPDLPHLRVKVLDGAHRPLANRKFTVAVMGTRQEGTTDGSGFVDVPVPKSADMAELEVFVDDPPGEHTLRFDLRIAADPLDPADTVRGAQQRLASLGVYHGALHGKATTEFRQALRRFQQTHQLPVTATLDDATRSKLEEVHGQ